MINILLMSAPQDLIRRASVLYHNTLLGFQGPGVGVEDIFILCFQNYHYSKPEAKGTHIDTHCVINDSTIQKLKEMSGSTTLAADSWIGKEYLKIHWTEYPKIWTILNCMLQLGISFQTMNKLLTLVSAQQHSTISPLILEQIIVAKS
jgi:hypothetical protein